MSKPLSAQIADSKLPVQIVGGTGSGKTTLLHAVASYALQQGTQVYVFDGKPSRKKWADLKEHPCMHYFGVNDPAHIPTIIDQMQQLCELLADETRSEESERVMVMIDEFNNQILYADILMSMEKVQGGKKGVDYSLALRTWAKLLLTQGRERNCITISTTHDAGTEATGMSVAMRNNNRYVILASPDSRENIEDAIQQHPVGVILVRSLERRKLLRRWYRKIPSDMYVALTNVGSSSQFRYVQWT